MVDKTMIYVGAGSPGDAHSEGLWRKEASEDQWHDLAENGLPPLPQARAIGIHPREPDRVYMGTQRGLYFSRDRGDTWKRANMPEGRIVWSIEFRPDNPEIMYLGVQGNEVFRSEDGGENWAYMSTIENPDGIQMQFAMRILGLACEPNRPDVMYAGLEVGGAARSLDAGKTWKIINSGLNGVDLLDLHAVDVGSPDSDAVFISNRTGVWRSRDRGDTWENTHVERISPFYYSRCVRVAPDDPNTVYACIGEAAGGASGGIVRSTNLGDTWERFDHDLNPKDTTFGVSINPLRSEQVYFVTRSGQVFGTHDGGASWTAHPLPEGVKDIMSVAVASA
jgi:photosystem II stability/assembly factor-like uncharacterized protein